MKKHIYCLLTIVLLLCGCEQVDVELGTQNNVADIKLPEVLYVAMADESQMSDSTMSRTYVSEDGKSILWNKGDEISYFAGTVHNVGYKYDGEDGASTVEFTKNSEGIAGFEVRNSYAVYPLAAQASCKENNSGMERLQVNFPAEQTYAPNSFGKGANVMVAVGEHSTDDNLFFRNACGYLVIKLYGADVKVKKIELTALGGQKLAGKGDIKPSYNAAPEVEMDDTGISTVTLNCGDGVELGTDKASATAFWFALPPVIFRNGFKIKVTPTQGNAFEMQTSKKVVINRNDVQPMAALQFTANAQSSHQLIYTRANSTEPLKFYNNMANPFDANITAHYYDEEEDHFVIEFDGPLTAIHDNAFRGKDVKVLVSNDYNDPTEVTDITSVIFPESLTTIGKCAFAGTALRELTIPGNVKLIDYYAFWECRDLASISILEGDEPLRMVADASSTARGMFGFSKLNHISFNRDIIYYHYVDGGNYNYENFESVFSLSFYSLTNNFPGDVGEVTVEIGPKVTQILPYMFVHRNIKSIIIPASVTSIGNYAFWSCDKLESITIPSTVSTLGNHCFVNCTGLNTVNLGASTVGESVFSECANLETVTIAGSVNSMGNGVFYNCKKIKTLSLEPSTSYTPLTLGYQTIDLDQKGPFHDGQLETLNWNREISYRLQNENGLDSDDEGVFSNKTTLANVTIGNQVKSIPPYTFANSGISSGTIPDGVNSIGKYAFYNCDGLTAVTFNAATVSDNAFDNCSNLTSLTIKGMVNSIGKHVFQGCDKLRAVTFEPSPSAATLTIDFQGEENDKKGPFYNCPLDYVYMDRDVKLAKNAILGRYESLFGEKPNLQQVTLGSQVKRLHAFEFAGSGLTTITIPGTLMSIGDDAFLDCDDLATVNIEAGTAPLTIAYQYVPIILGGGELFMSERGPFYDSPLASITLMRELNYVDVRGDAFTPDEWDEGIFANSHYDDGNLITSITLGGNLTTISPWMFSGVRVQHITIPSAVTSVGKYAFEDCRALKTVTLGAATVGLGAFYECKNLESVTICSSVESIGHNSFVYCNKLATVNIEENSNPLAIGYQLYNSAEYGPFYDSPLASITFKRDIAYKNEDGDAFTPDSWEEGVFANKHYNNNAFVTSLSIGSKVTTILPYMFSGVRMENLTIPASVTSIGKLAFWDCRVLSHVTCQGTTAPTLGSEAFEDCDKLASKNSIAVPYSADGKVLQDYQSKWSEYEDKLYVKP